MSTSIETWVGDGEIPSDHQGNIDVVEHVVQYRSHDIQGEQDNEWCGLNEDEEDLTHGQVAAKARRGRKRKNSVALKLPDPPAFEPLILRTHHARVILPDIFNDTIPAPVTIFRLFFSDDILDTTVANTNSYAAEKSAGSVSRAWKSISRNELVIWLALTIYIGIHRMKSKACWNTDRKDPIHDISKFMSLSRYDQIKRYLHVSDVSAPKEPYWSKLELLLSRPRRCRRKKSCPPDVLMDTIEATSRLFVGPAREARVDHDSESVSDSSTTLDTSESCSIISSAGCTGWTGASGSVSLLSSEGHRWTVRAAYHARMDPGI